MQNAMLSARRVVVLECAVPREVALSQLRARDHASDGKGVRGVAPETVHARYAAEVCALRTSLLERARDAGVSVQWHTGSPSELVAYVPRLLSDVH